MRYLYLTRHIGGVIHQKTLPLSVFRSCSLFTFCLFVCLVTPCDSSPVVTRDVIYCDVVSENVVDRQLKKPKRRRSDRSTMKSSHRFLPLLSLLILPFIFVDANTLTKLSHAWSFVTDFVFTRHSLKYTGELTGLQVIGAGFGRTGTKSIEAGLHGLGHRIYDLRSILENSHGDRWVLCAKEWKQGKKDSCEALIADLEREGYTATLDFPLNLFALVLADLRPDAKVLFSVRDTEEKWIKSWAMIVKTLSCFVSRPWKWVIPEFHFVQEAFYELEDFYWKEPKYEDGDFVRVLPWFETLVYHPHLDNTEGQQEWIELHRKFQAKLQANLSEDRLLVYNVKEGWGPLVPFLGLDDSYMNTPFPNVNDRKSVEIIRKVMDVMAIGLPVWCLMLLYVAVRLVRFVVKVLPGHSGKNSKKLKTV